MTHLEFETLAKNGFGETKKPHAVYGWDEFVSPCPFIG